MKKIITHLILVLYAGAAAAQPCLPNTSALIFGGFVSFTTDNNLQVTDSVSVEAWVYSSFWGATSAQNSIFCKHSWTQGEQGYALRAGGTGELSFNMAGIDSNGLPVSWVELISPAGILPLNTWIHVAGTYDGNDQRLYVNGNLVASQHFKGTIVQSTAFPPKIGALSEQNTGSTRYWIGMMDEIRVWHRAISQAEIQSNMNRHIDPALQSGLIGYWRFNENTGGITADLSFSGNAGTLNGNQWSPQVPFNEVPSTPSITWNGTQLQCNPAATTYQWNLNGIPVNGATQQTWIPLQNGLYTVTITNAAGCTGTSAQYNFNGLGINEYNNSEIKITQNTEAHLITVNIPLNMAADKIELADEVGRAVVSIINPISHSVPIDTRNFIPGVYFVKVMSGKDFRVKQIIVR
ncbi:MAG TPA: LamG-like jellyroll fold domain-containing protein [Bacteroidia bacterium]|nr:LamG-like jellyroll fold domain-containing protein [Bacteroidia bacterium]